MTFIQLFSHIKAFKSIPLIWNMGQLILFIQKWEVIRSLFFHIKKQWGQKSFVFYTACGMSNYWAYFMI